VGRFIVDTNVPIVANGLEDPDSTKTPSVDCRISAINFLTEVLAEHQVCVDLAGAVQQEYAKYLSASGQPGVGDRFYQAVINSAPQKILRQELQLDADGQYAALPDSIRHSTFDQSDRKFAALALELAAPVANCVDSDWLIHHKLLKESGIRVQFVCGPEPNGWFEESSG
jgi:hypothetical protein